MKLLRKSLLVLLSILLVSCAGNTTQQLVTTVTAPTEQYMPSAKNLEVSVTSSLRKTVEPLLKLYETLEGVSITINEIPDGEDEVGFATSVEESGLIIADNIYNIDGLAKRDKVIPIANLESPLLAALSTEVPDYIYSAEDVAFLPVGIDGYAYLCNTELLGDILSEDDNSQLADNLRRASSAQWSDALGQLYSLILSDGGEGEIVRLSAAEYELPESLPEGIENLVAPFAVDMQSPASLIAPLSVVFNGVELEPEAKDGLMLGYAEFIMEETNMVATPDGVLERGDNPQELYADLTTETAAALYEQDKVLFWRSTLSDAYRYLSEDALANTVVFPMKMPIESFEDITHSYTLGASLTVTTPFVFAVAAQTDPEQYAAAMDFLVWFYYSETGRSYITDTLGLLEINHLIAKNPLSIQLADYIENDNVMTDMLLYTPPQQLLLAQEIVYNDYMSIEVWSQDTQQQLATALFEIFN